MKSSKQTVGYASWEDPYKWMESMTGTRWNTLVHYYEKEYEEAVKDLGDLPTVVQHELQQRESLIPPMKIYDCWYEQTGKQNFCWWYNKEKHYCTDLDIGKDGYVWHLEDTSNGDERYSLHCFHHEKKVWNYTLPLGPYVAVVGNRVYCIESENHLWFHRLVSLNAKTGKDRKVLYEEENPEWNLTLIRGEHQCLFLVANNAGVQRLWYLKDKDDLMEIKGYESYVPIGFSSPSSKTPVFFGRRSGDVFYKIVGGPHHSFLEKETPEFASFTDDLVVTRHYGVRSLWSLSTGKKKDRLLGQFQPDILTAWHTGKANLSTSRPGYAMTLYSPGVDCLCSYGFSQYRFATSEDGTRVPYVIVQARYQRPTHLLVVGYGAYGITSHLNTDRWKPLLRRGWAVCLALIRGGGDHTDAWAQAARTIHKGRSIEDFTACIRASQKYLRIRPSQTAIYGRSAGGYLLGSTISRYSKGNLFQFAYLEVPYLDVLSTTANPTLPLTQLEYNEFGNPLHHPQDFQALLDLSPMDTVPAGGVPSIFVLCRTGLHDKEVFAYESFKWITKLKEAQGEQGQPKLLAVKKKEGHFVSGSSAEQNRAKDLSLLLNWGLRKLKTQQKVYPMNNVTRRNRKNRKNTRKNRKNNMTMRKNNMRKNNMMGGKRKRRNMTRRRR